MSKRRLRIADKIPMVTSPISRDLRMFCDRVRDVLGADGDQKVATVADLVSIGLIDSNLRPVPTSTVQQEFLATPPAITGLEADGAFQNVIIDWDQPDYNGHLYVEVWGSPIFDANIAPGAPGYVDPATLNNLELANPVGITSGNVFTDSIGGSRGRWYWVRNVNRLGSPGPFNAVGGTLAETAVDVEFLLDTLTDSITRSQLFDDLGQSVDKIPGIEINVDNLNDQYTVKIDTNGYVSGFGLANVPVDGAIESQFIIRADSFSIAEPSSGTPSISPSIPFIVRTTPTVIGGVSVPAGVYMNEVFVQNGTITNAKIADLAVDNAKIANLSAEKINAGFISADRIAAESINATKIDARGLTIRDTAGNIILNAVTNNYTGNVAGTAASTVVNTANSALSTANTATSAASTAQSTANTAVTNASTAQSTANTAVTNASTAQSTANTAVTNAATAQTAADNAQGTANTALSTANSAVNGLTTKLNSDARNVLAGAGGIAAGTLNWDGSGTRTGGYGVGLTQNGLVAYNTSGAVTFALDATTGNASFAGELAAATGSFNGAVRIIGATNMIVTQATAFGPNSLIQWYGPVAGNLSSGVPILANLTRANAITWIAANGEYSRDIISRRQATSASSATVTHPSQGSPIVSRGRSLVSAIYSELVFNQPPLSTVVSIAYRILKQGSIVATSATASQTVPIVVEQQDSNSWLVTLEFYIPVEIEFEETIGSISRDYAFQVTSVTTDSGLTITPTYSTTVTTTEIKQ